MLTLAWVLSGSLLRRVDGFGGQEEFRVEVLTLVVVVLGNVRVDGLCEVRGITLG